MKCIFIYILCTRNAGGKVRSPARSDPKLCSVLECGGGGRTSAGRIYGDHRHPKGSLASGGHVYFSLSHSTRTLPPHTTALHGAVRSLYNIIYIPPKVYGPYIYISAT